MADDQTTRIEAVMRGGHVGIVERDAAKCVGIIVCDSESKILHVNKKAAQLFLRSVSAMVDKPLSTLMLTAAGARHDRWFAEWWNNGRATREMGARQEIVGVRGDNQTIRLAVTISPTVWYGQPAALAVLLPASYLPEHTP